MLGYGSSFCPSPYLLIAACLGASKDFETMAMAHFDARVAFGLVLATFHWRTTWADAFCLVQEGLRYLRPAGSSAGGSVKRVNEAMDRMREESYVVTARLAQHLNVACVISVPLVYDGDIVIFVGMMFVNLSLYSMHWLLSTGRLHLSCRGLRCLFGFFYLLLLASHWIGPQSYGVEASSHLRALEASQMISILVFVDGRTHVCGQLVLALSEVCRHVLNHGWEPMALVLTIHGQLIFSGLLVISAIVLEFTLRGRVAAQFQHSDAESLVSSFRTLLRGISDAELLLDDKLRIEASTGLSHILLSGNAWEGIAFQQLLSQDNEEKLRFQSFISREREGDKQTEATPSCLRVSLQTAQQQRVGVDLFHVQVPRLYGCTDAYHLLAMKMDAESIVPPEAAPAQNPPVTLRSMSSVGHAPRSASSQTPSEGSLLPSLPHLSELVLVVDGHRQQEVVQVHVQYKQPQRPRREEEGNLRNPAETFPTLRQFVRPTEWQSVSSQLHQFATRVRSGNLQNGSLGKVWIRMLDNPRKYMQARHSSLSFRDRGAEGQVWVHLQDFRNSEERGHRPSELGEVSEGLDEEQE